MPFLKTIIPLFIVLGLLQAAVLALPNLYWRFSFYLNPIERFLFGSLLLFTAFILHPLIVIALITFTIAPTLLAARHTIYSRLSTIYTALLPSSLTSPSLGAQELFPVGRPQSGRDWLLTLMGSYVGWKALGAPVLVMVVGVFLALRGGKEEDVGVGMRGGEGVGEVAEEETRVRGGKRETGVSVRRRRRTDVQVVG